MLRLLQLISPMQTLTRSELAQQVENLARYILSHPAENLTIYCAQVMSAAGDTLARFNNHLQAAVAVRTIREEISKAA